MIWEDEQDIINELLYWQKRALEAERKLKSESLESSIAQRIKEEKRRGMIEVDGDR